MNRNRIIPSSVVRLQRRHRQGSVAAACTTALLLASPAQAQRVVEEIIVTAQLREQSLQDVPLAIAAFDQRALSRAGVRDLRDLTQLSPSLVLTSTQSESAGTTARIRGIGTTGDNLGLESSVAVFVDGVYRNRNNVALTDLGAIERVEVLRGPQGTTFGKNASAGTIQIITQRPDAEQFSGYIQGELGNFSHSRFSGGLTGPILGEQLAFRIDASVTQRDGFVEDIASGTRYNDRDRYLVRGQLTSQITPDLDLRLIADYASRDESCCAAVTLIDGTAALLIPQAGGTLISPARPFGRQMTANAERGYDQVVDEVGISAELNWDLGFGTLTSITAWRDWELERSQDIDFTDADILYRSRGSNDQRFKTISQELRLAGDLGPVQWLAGFIYIDEQLTYRDAIRGGAGFQSYFDALAQTPGALLLLTGGVPFQAGDGVSQDVFRQDADSWALFTHNIWSITDRLDLTVGLRFTEETKKLNAVASANNPACQAGAANVGNVPAPLQPLLGLVCLPLINPFVDGAYDGRRKDSELTGTVNLSYRLTEDWLGYVSYSRGYKAGGFNLDRGGLANPLLGLTPSASDLEFDPETVDSYEIGLKGGFWDNLLQLNLAVFYAEFKDFQLNTFDGTNFIVSNVDKVESQGVELEFQLNPGEGFSLRGGAAYTDARYASGLAAPNQNLSGRRITNAPYWTVTGAAGYERMLGVGLRGFVNVDYRFNGRMNTGSDLAPEKIQPSYSIWNGRIGLGPDSDRWVFEIWARNLFDKDYRQVVIDAPLQAQPFTPQSTFAAFLGDPRTYGASLRINF
ncbi:MAG: TonB-dependent receptor [Chromatiales bacterium]|nr:TonB-dependent receptor [Chromatiales bacterium]